MQYPTVSYTGCKVSGLHCIQNYKLTTKVVWLKYSPMMRALKTIRAVGNGSITVAKIINALSDHDYTTN